ncbi:MAG: hypothetical protein ACYTF1_19360 [Planctomycetota bacterium]|jgi:asparaginyl-tRNA synthetase
MSENNTVFISNLDDHVGSSVTLAGWLYNSRVSSKVALFVVRDGTAFCQRFDLLA